LRGNFAVPKSRVEPTTTCQRASMRSGRQVVRSPRPSIRTPAEPGPQARRGFAFPRQWKQTIRYQRPRKTTRERRRFLTGRGLPQRTLAGWRRDQLTTRRANGLVRSSHGDFRVVRDIWATEQRCELSPRNRQATFQRVRCPRFTRKARAGFVELTQCGRKTKEKVSAL
jgi:hypothetical protein